MLQVVALCLGKRPALRPSAEQLGGHSWLESAALSGRADLTALLCDTALYGDRATAAATAAASGGLGSADPPGGIGTGIGTGAGTGAGMVRVMVDPQPIRAAPSPLPPAPAPYASRSVHFSAAVLFKEEVSNINHLHPDTDPDPDPARPNPTSAPKFVPGTTWVFDSGEKAAAAADGEESGGDLAEFLRSFEDEQATLTRSSPRPSPPPLPSPSPPSASASASAPPSSKGHPENVDSSDRFQEPEQDLFNRRFRPRPSQESAVDIGCSTKDFLDDFENDVGRDES